MGDVTQGTIGYESPGELVFQVHGRQQRLLAVADSASTDFFVMFWDSTATYESSVDYTDTRGYDVTPDGERFVLLKWPAGVVRRRVVVATHWFDELRARVDGQGGR